MLVFANTVGEVDEASLREAKRGSAGSHVPADCAQRAAGAGPGRGLNRILRQFQPQVTLFHDARRAQQANAAGDKDRLGVAVAEWLQLAQPANQNIGDAVQGQLGVNVQQLLRLAGGQMLLGVEAQALLQLRQGFGGQGKTHGEGVTAEAREEIGAAFDGVEQLEAVHRAP